MSDRVPCSQLRLKSPSNFAREGGSQFDMRSAYEINVDLDSQLAYVADLEKNKVAIFPLWHVEHFVPADPAAMARAEKRGPGRPPRNPGA